MHTQSVLSSISVFSFFQTPQDLGGQDENKSYNIKSQAKIFSKNEFLA